MYCKLLEVIRSSVSLLMTYFEVILEYDELLLIATMCLVMLSIMKYYRKLLFFCHFMNVCDIILHFLLWTCKHYLSS